MSKTYIKYPIAFHKKSEKLVDISDVTDENKKELICLECKESFVAVRKHQTPHFKHKTNSKCKGNVESYIHWVTKEVFKKIKEIELPEIFKDNLTDTQREKLNNKVNSLIEKQVPKNLHLKFRRDLKKNISENGVFQIEKIETEKEFKTSLGNVRIDIVATINNQKLFVEPFFTNQIDDLKKQKLTLTNIPTLSIDLVSFVQRFNYSYNLENLKAYLISKNSKTWIFNREKQIEKYATKYLEYVIGEIKKNKRAFDTNNSELERISKLENKINKLEETIRPTKEKIRKTRDEINQLKIKLGIEPYDF